MPITTKSSASVDPDNLFKETKYSSPRDVQFRKLIENSREGISLFDKQFNVIYRSPSAERISGWNTSGRVKTAFENLIHPDDETEVVKLLNEIAEQPGISKNCTFRSRHFEGHYIWLECTFTNMLNDSDVQAIVCNFRDVTSRKGAEELLQQTMQELFAYKYALDESSIIAITDQKGIIRHVNENFCRISKYNADELIGQDHRIINSSYHDKAFIRDLWVTIAKGKIWKGELKNKAKDGSFYWVDTTIVPFLNEAGKPYQYIAIRSDITKRKLAELEITRKTEQVDELLESITDGFIALDEHMNYTYANKKIGEMLGCIPDELIGKNIWAIFPEAVGSATYQAIQTAFTDKRYICNEDYYAPLKLWQENRVYPSGKGLSIFIRDITRQKEEEHHLKLLESVITNTTDAVMITEAEPQQEPGPRIIYVNEAFTKMTGYLPDEVIGKNPRFLQGPKSDRAELDRLAESMRKWQPCEITIVNYKKNGEEFWINFSITPVANENGWYTHWISTERDVTKWKNEELQKTLLTRVSQIFNEPAGLSETLSQVLKRLTEFGNFSMAEVWLVGSDKNRINLTAKFSDEDDINAYFSANAEIKSFAKKEGIPGLVWETHKIQSWNSEESSKIFVRWRTAKLAGLRRVYGLPLNYNNEVIGVLLLGLNTNEKPGNAVMTVLENFSTHLGAEIKRKQLELELNQVFNFAPDIICITGTDLYFKKVNPAMCSILEYSEEELLSRPMNTFLHPDELAISKKRMENLIESNQALFFENRYITKSGKTKWLSWAAANSNEEGLLYCVAKDITDKKELEKLLSKATDLARIGGWEVDLLQNTVYWSDITREIHEVDEGFVPDFESGLNFYKDGESREKIKAAITAMIDNDVACDIELQIVTAKGRVKWIRVIGEAEFIDDKCIRLYGSFQDIDVRKIAELGAKRSLEERNTILESIGDAFFAVDKNWIVTYWNHMASKVLGRSKMDIIDHNLWEVFADAKSSVSYQKYHEAVETNRAIHFEDYYAPMQKWYEISAYPSDNGLSVYFKDITERKTSEMRLQELNQNLQVQTKELAISNSELEQFAYVASHDLQEPLRMVTSFLSQIEKKYSEILDDKGRQYIHFAVDGAKRMRQIILDLLDFSRVGRSVDSMEPVDLNKLIYDINSLFHKQIEELQAVVEFADLPVIKTFKAPIRQVFQNLIGNSLKYHREYVKPIIKISSKDVQTHWEFCVEDNGIGIDEEYFDKIFIIFQRLHNKSEYSGTGMGLAITKKIVENMGGKIWLNSAEGKGSAFYFTIEKLI